MAEFNKDDYLNDLPTEPYGGSSSGASAGEGSGYAATDGRSPSDDAKNASASSAPADTPADAAAASNGAAGASDPKGDTKASDQSGTAESGNAEGKPAEGEGETKTESKGDGSDNTLTPLGQAKKEAADYLEALQRERAEFINYRNRAKKEQERFRQHGIIDVLTALLPALDDIDRIREHGELNDSMSAVAAKIDKAFAKFGVEKFGEKGEDFDPTRHDAILHKPDASAEKETVDTVVEAGYRIGDRVIRAARVVVASPQH